MRGCIIGIFVRGGEDCTVHPPHGDEEGRLAGADYDRVVLFRLGRGSDSFLTISRAAGLLTSKALNPPSRGGSQHKSTTTPRQVRSVRFDTLAFSGVELGPATAA